MDQAATSSALPLSVQKFENVPQKGLQDKIKMSLKPKYASMQSYSKEAVAFEGQVVSIDKLFAMQSPVYKPRERPSRSMNKLQFKY